MFRSSAQQEHIFQVPFLQLLQKTNTNYNYMKFLRLYITFRTIRFVNFVHYPMYKIQKKLNRMFQRKILCLIFAPLQTLENGSVLNTNIVHNTLAASTCACIHDSDFASIKLTHVSYHINNGITAMYYMPGYVHS